MLLDYTTSQTHLPPLTHVRFVLCCPAGLTLTDSHSCASVAPNPVPRCGAHTWLGGTHSHRLTQLRIRPPLSVSCRSQPGPEAHALGGTHSHTHSCTHPATSVARLSLPTRPRGARTRRDSLCCACFMGLPPYESTIMNYVAATPLPATKYVFCVQGDWHPNSPQWEERVLSRAGTTQGSTATAVRYSRLWRR